jgi:two-component system nitrogen regulation sensor histidine kinase GlnL
MKTKVRNREDPSQRILDNLNIVVLLFDEQLRLRYLNPAGEMLFAVSARHLIGQPAGELVRCPDHRLNDLFQQALGSGLPFTEREIALLTPDMREITVDCTVMPLVEPGQETGVLVELQQLDRQLRISREEHLISQHQATRDLIRGLAHEIKNPLGGLRGAAQLLERELPSPSLQEYTRIIIEEADRLTELVNRMLGPNKLPRYRAVNIHQVLDRVRQLVQAEVGNGVELVCDYDPSIPELHADSDQLIQALLNILRNAARAVGDEGRITLRTRIQRNFTIGNDRHRLVAQIDIVDNGPGISPELLEKIFYPMVSACEGGMGLGLSIAQSLINQHGGLIECQSKPGETAFTVLLPLENPNARSL